MKRSLMLVIFVMVAVMAVGLMALGSSEDYKVVKNAVTGKDSSGEMTWLKIEVTEKAAKKTKVKIQVPFSLVELISECEKEVDLKDIDIKGKCKVDLKKILEILKKNGPTTLIEVDDEDDYVKIWVE